jgi:hypothetical protein
MVLQGRGGIFVSETGPSSEQIVSEWIISDSVGDSARWWDGICRYEAASLDDGAAMGEAAELMCAALAYYVVAGTVICDIEDESPETAVEQTIWNVLVATLYGGGGQPLSANSAKCLRLAVAAARRGGYQAQDLGGNGLMAEMFDDDTRGLMTDALSGWPARPDDTPAQLTRWFTSQAAPEPSLATLAVRTGGTMQPGAASPGEGAVSAESRWGALRKRAQEARQYVNPLVLQHGIEAIQGALTEAQIAKRDKAGKLKIRKFGVAKAALRPSKTLRRALEGAALPEHLKAFNQQVYGTGVDSPDRERATPDIQSNRGEPTMASVAGWYADPTGKAELRYWDGSAWTQRTKNRADGDEVSAPIARPKLTAKPRPARQRSEICVIKYICMETRATDRRTRKDFPYEIWFAANALGPNGLYRAAESSTFNSYTSYLSRDKYSEATFNELVKKLWEDGWEPTSGAGHSKLDLWYEYRFRRPVEE